LESKKKKGKIPSYAWLHKNGYEGLIQCMYKHPEFFSHLERDTRTITFKTIKEHIKIAEQLAKENNGILQSYVWLRNNGYIGLSNFLSKYPEKFRHIKREKNRKTIGKQIEIAEQLVKENNGILPSMSSLRKNGYIGLVHCMRKNPKKFLHLKQKYEGGKTIDQWVKIAEQLAKKNNGILPPISLLRKNKFHKGLVSVLRRHPKNFAHIRQKKLRKSAEEWIEIAKDLIKKNNKVLPKGLWLTNNGYQGLYCMLTRYPEKFKGLKQEYYVNNIKKVRIIGE